jgi:hypothetical protein
MTAMSIICIPQDLLYFVANFFLAREDQNKLIFKFSRDWRNFLNTSKHYFAEWKRKSQVVLLQGLYADIFVTYQRFRERIFRSLENPAKQLELHYHHYNIVRGKRAIDLGNVKGLKKLMITNCDISNFPYVSEEICVDSCKTNKHSQSPPTRRFTARGSGFFIEGSIISWVKLTEEVFFTNLNQNYPWFAHLQGSISISDSPLITDVSCFKNVKSLHFYNCSNITDVSNLGNVYELSLQHCIGVTDVSALGKVYHLDLTGCINITDVSALGNVHTLYLCECTEVTDVSALKNVKELVGFEGDDVSGLQNVEKLSVPQSFVTDISMLKKLKELNINRCEVSEFQGLNNLRILEIGGSADDSVEVQPFVINSGEEVFEILTALHTNDLFVSDTRLSASGSSVLSFHHLPNLTRWTLCGCIFTEFSSSLAKLRELRIGECECESLFLELPCLAELSIDRCRETTSVEISGKNGCNKSPLSSVTISGCYSLIDIVITRRISVLKILDCKKSSRLTVDRKSQINHLKIEDCPNIHISAFAPIVCLSGDEKSERDYFVRRYQDS